MKYYLFLLLLFATGISNGQSLGKRIKNAAKRTAENKIVQKTSQAVDKGMDKAIDGAGDALKKKEDSTKSSGNQDMDATVQSGETSANAETQVAALPDSSTNSFGVFRKFTFVPGNKVIFYDDFSKDASGDFPVNWGTGGSGEVVSISSEPGNWLSMQRRSGYLPALSTDLPENYTIEFDLVTNGYGPGKTSSKLYLAFPSKNAYTMGQAGSIADIELLLYKYFSVARAENFGSEAKIKVGSVIDRHLPELINAKMHISIAVNKQRLRFWINEEKYVDAPSILQGNMGKHFLIQAMDILPEKGQFAAITNFRIAEAGEDLRSKLMKEGKFSTSGIFFNTNSDEVKKESFAVLKSISDMMRSDANIKLNIVGHTDNVGDKEFNQGLSVRRAEAVKNILVNEFSIEENRFRFSGKGASVPVDDNATDKGRANNRRVEFVKF